MMVLNRVLIEKDTANTHVASQEPVGRKGIFRGIERLALLLLIASASVGFSYLFCPESASAEDEPASNNWQIEHHWSFAGDGEGFLASIDQSISTFTFTDRETCKDVARVDCNGVWLQPFRYSIDGVIPFPRKPDEGAVYSEKVKETEDLLIAVFEQHKETSQPVLQAFRTDLGLFLAEYTADPFLAPYLSCNLSLNDNTGHTVWSQSCGTGAIAHVYVRQKNDRSWGVAIDGRSCGASACVGSIEYWSFEQK